MMAEDSTTTTVAGSYKKAISDGKEIRKKTKEMAAKASKTLLVLVVVATFVWAGYAFFDWAWSEKKTPENLTQGQTKTVMIAGAWHEEKVPPGKRVCYDPFDKLMFREDTSAVAHYLKSKDDKPLSVHIFHVRYGQPCKKT